MNLSAAQITARRHWMSVLARASADEIAATLSDGASLPGHSTLRAPQTGMVMLRGRAGGTGAAFNLGEITVTRCSVRLASGSIGHAYVIGRDARQAELAAVLDAALQDDDRLLASVIEPLAAAQAERRHATETKAAATRVEFFTLATMRT
jgi:alpha-D-ribose 1-methylphosphonate 5-triphosphate synthase subunit PhnG